MHEDLLYESSSSTENTQPAPTASAVSALMAKVAAQHAEINRLKNKMPPEMIPRPIECVPLQYAMGLGNQKVLYNRCRAAVREAAVGQVNYELPWRLQPDHVLLEIISKAQETESQLSRYENHWAGLEILKSVIQSKRQHLGISERKTRAARARSEREEMIRQLANIRGDYPTGGWYDLAKSDSDSVGAYDGRLAESESDSEECDDSEENAVHGFVRSYTEEQEAHNWNNSEEEEGGGQNYNYEDYEEMGYSEQAEAYNWATSDEEYDTGWNRESRATSKQVKVAEDTGGYSSDEEFDNRAKDVKVEAIGKKRKAGGGKGKDKEENRKKRKLHKKGPSVGDL